jgi:hypothetical protein
MSSSFQGGQTICILPIFGIPFRNYKQVDKLTTSRSQTTIDNNFNSRNSTKHSKGKYKFCFEEYLSLIFFGKSTNSWSCSL